MRCLTLASELKEQGEQIRFISRNLPAHLIGMLEERSIEYLHLRTDDIAEPGHELAHAKWLGTSQAQDAQATTAVLADHLWDWIVVDHYALDMRWESSVRACAKQLMVIDDLADRQHDCDVLLDQNLYADMQARYSGKVSAQCQLLLGPRYALLTENFRRLREQLKPRAGAVERILVFFGGVDADNYTSLAIEAMAELNSTRHVDVVIGLQHPFRAQIVHSCAERGYGCYVQTPRMAELMAEADLAIGAGGTSMWERCCLGLPALSLCVAENQRRQIADAAEMGLLYAPTRGQNVVDTIVRHTTLLLENPALLKMISTTAMNAVDGRGAKRIVNSMTLGAIDIRRVNAHDSLQIFEWRNHPSIRAVSRDSALIAWKDHKTWFDAAIKDKDRELLIGVCESQPMGVVRFDRVGDDAEVSIYLVPDDRFIGQGRNLLLSAERWLKTNRPDIKCLLAIVLGENAASNGLFLGSNYKKLSTSYKKVLLTEKW